jgi:DNA-binding Xre family transcriptional regulator
MTTRADDPKTLREEIHTILDGISDRGSLLYFLWLLRRIAKNEPLPAIQELKKLHRAFVHVAEALDDKTKKFDEADWALVDKYMNAGSVRISRPLGLAVKFYRERRGLTRLELSNRCRVALRAVIALERGQIKDISLPRFEQLARALGIEPADLMDKIMEFIKASG